MWSSRSIFKKLKLEAWEEKNKRVKQARLIVYEFFVSMDSFFFNCASSHTKRVWDRIMRKSFFSRCFYHVFHIIVSRRESVLTWKFHDRFSSGVYTRFFATSNLISPRNANDERTYADEFMFSYNPSFRAPHNEFSINIDQTRAAAVCVFV